MYSEIHGKFGRKRGSSAYPEVLSARFKYACDPRSNVVMDDFDCAFLVSRRRFQFLLESKPPRVDHSQVFFSLTYWMGSRNQAPKHRISQIL
jgi:hypothetical protein